MNYKTANGRGLWGIKENLLTHSFCVCFAKPFCMNMGISFDPSLSRQGMFSGTHITDEEIEVQ
jgi:hypothetical protein